MKTYKMQIVVDCKPLEEDINGRDSIWLSSQTDMVETLESLDNVLSVVYLPESFEASESEGFDILNATESPENLEVIQEFINYKRNIILNDKENYNYERR